MLETPSAEAQQFVAHLREEVSNTLETIRRRTFSVNQDELLSPASITAGLVLAAADFCHSNGLSMAEFVSMLKVFTSDLENLSKSMTGE